MGSGATRERSERFTAFTRAKLPCSPSESGNGSEDADRREARDRGATEWSLLGLFHERVSGQPSGREAVRAKRFG